MPSFIEYMKRALDRSRCLIRTTHQDDYIFPRRYGECFWTLRNTVTGRETHGHVKNVVTLDASIPIAAFLKGTGTSIPNQCVPKYGIYALAVGTGDVSWDPMNPPSPTDTQRSLYNEIARKAVAVTSFIDEGGMISGVRTRIVDFTTTFTESEAVGAITEMGLIGGDNDSNMSIRNPILPPNGPYDPTIDTTGKDILFNYVTFAVKNKGPNETLSWCWRIAL